jgi:hypothetical protein
VVAGLTRVRLHLWHRLLTPGWLRPTPAARLRGWARVIAWREADVGGRLRLAKRAVWTPVRAWKEAQLAVTRFGDDVQAASGVPASVQRRHLAWLAVRHGLPVASYPELLLFRTERRARAAGYVHETEFNQLMVWCARSHPPVDDYPERDKPGFTAWCRRHGFPTTATILTCDARDELTDAEECALAALLPPRDLFSKPADGDHGVGIAAWCYDGADGWIGMDGQTRSARGLIRELTHQSRTLPPRFGVTSHTRPMMIQPRMQNHRDLLRLTSGGLGTARLLTCRLREGTARLVKATYRMPTGNAAGDKIASGALVAPVDLASGRLGPALQPRGSVLVSIERHPDTGATIAESELPDWPGATALALAAHEAAPGRPTMGWDVAFSDGGPLLIEGNTVPNPRIVQMPDGVPLGETIFPLAIEQYVRQRLETGRSSGLAVSLS